MSCFRSVRYVLGVLGFAIIIALYSILVHLPLCGFFLVHRFFAWIYVRTFRKDIGKFVPGFTNIFVVDCLQKSPSYNVVNVSIFENKFDLEEAKCAFQERVLDKKKPDGSLDYPELKQRFTCSAGFFFWKDEKKFDLSRHARFYDYEGDLKLPNPCTEEDLKRVMPGLSKLPWEKGLSPWEMLVVDNYKCDVFPERKMAVIFRMHHGMGDGYSFLKLLLFDLLRSEKALKIPRITPPSIGNQLCTALFMPILMPILYGIFLMDTADGVNSWFLPKNKLQREYYIVSSKPVSINLIKNIKDKHGVGFNAVLMGVTVRAVKKLMEAAKQKVPKDIGVIIPFPLPYHPGGLVNHASVLAVHLPMSHKTGLECVKAIFDKIGTVNTTAVVLSQLMWAKILGISSAFFTRIFFNHMSTSTLTVSFFPGPEVGPTFLGSRVVDFIVSCGLGSGRGGAMLVTLSINGTLRFVLTVDKAVYPDEKLLHETFDSQIQEELKTMLESPSSKALKSIDQPQTQV